MSDDISEIFVPGAKLKQLKSGDCSFYGKNLVFGPRDTEYFDRVFSNF